MTFMCLEEFKSHQIYKHIFNLTYFCIGKTKSKVQTLWINEQMD